MIRYGGVEGCLSSLRAFNEHTRFRLVFSMWVFRGLLCPIGRAMKKTEFAARAMYEKWRRDFQDQPTWENANKHDKDVFISFAETVIRALEDEPDCYIPTDYRIVP